MSKNIEININNGNSYETLYPKTLSSLIDGTFTSSKISDLEELLATKSNKIIKASGVFRGDGTFQESNSTASFLYGVEVGFVPHIFILTDYTNNIRINKFIQTYPTSTISTKPANVAWPEEFWCVNFNLDKSGATHEIKGTYISTNKIYTTYRFFYGMASSTKFGWHTGLWDTDITNVTESIGASASFNKNKNNYWYAYRFDI